MCRCGRSSLSGKSCGYGHAVVQHVQVVPLEINDPLATTRSFMYASRMFHSLGTVQSKTAVPVGTSKILQRNSFTDQFECLPNPVCP